MRDVLLMSIIAVAALAALRRPWIGFMLWLWLSLMNPHRYTYGFAYDAPVAALAAASTILGILINQAERESPLKGPPVTLLVIFTLWVTISWLMGLDVSGDYEQWKKVMKINLLLVVGLAVMRTKEHIFVFAWVATLSIALLAAKGGVFTILNGGNYRVWGPEGTFIGGNNEFAVATIMTIPLLRFMQQQATQAWLRHLLMAMMLLCAVSAIGSHSRGALLAIVGMSLVLWWRSRGKVRGALLMVIFGFLLLQMMPEHWFTRMDTIETYESDSSAMGRISAWWVSWRVAFEYPTGVGFSIVRHDLFARFSPYYDGKVLVAHSIYFQVLGHHGFPGLFMFLLMWLLTLRSSAAIRRTAASNPQIRWAADLAGMCQVSLVGYFVGGAFLDLAYYDFPYYVMAIVVLTKVWVQTRAWEHEPAQVTGWRALIGLGAGGAAAQGRPAGQPRQSRGKVA